MQQVKQFTQAYKLVPWRGQLQYIGAFMLVVVVSAVVAGIYLSVTARANSLGREIQQMQVRMDGPHQVMEAIDNPVSPDRVTIEELHIQIADVQTRIAYLTSEEVMRERALKLGFQVVDPQNAEYVDVEGYRSDSHVQLAPSAGPVQASSVVLPDSYRESLLDFGMKMVDQLVGQITGEVRP